MAKTSMINREAKRAKLAKQQQATMQRLYARYMAQGGTMPQQ